MISLLRRRWRTILICLIIGGLGAYLYLLKTTKVYQAVAEVEINLRRPGARGGGSSILISISDGDPVVNTRFAKFLSPSKEKMVIAEFRKQYSKDGRSNAELSDVLRNKVSWSRGHKADIIGHTGESSEPVFASRMVNVLAHYFVSQVIHENKAISDEAVKWLNIQVEEQRADLDTIERQLLELRAASKEAPGEALEHEARLARTERQREEANEILRNIERRMEEARMSADEDAASIRVIREAEVPIIPIRPRKLIVLLGSLLGAGFGCLLALLIEFRSQRGAR